MIDDTSIEFDMFEDVRRKLVRVLEAEGHNILTSEKIALYIVQGVREMPKLLTVINDEETHTSQQAMKVVRAVLNNAVALDKAKQLLLTSESA